MARIAYPNNFFFIVEFLSGKDTPTSMLVSLLYHFVMMLRIVGVVVIAFTATTVFSKTVISRLRFLGLPILHTAFIIAAFRMPVNKIREATLCQLVFTSVDYKVAWQTLLTSFCPSVMASGGGYLR